MPSQETEQLCELLGGKSDSNPPSNDAKSDTKPSAPAADSADSAKPEKKESDKSKSGSETASPDAAPTANADADKSKDKAADKPPEHDDEKDPVITMEEFDALENKEQKNKMFGFLKNLKKKKEDTDENTSDAHEIEKKLNDALLKIEKLDGKFEMVQSSKSETSERLGSLSESIGELRSMIFSREEENGKMEDEFEKIKEAAADMKPDKIRKELDQREKETVEVQSNVELVKQKVENMNTLLQKQSEILDKFKSFENMIEIANQIKKEAEKAKDSGKYTERMAAKTEKLFAEVDERLQEFREYKKEVDDMSEMVKDLVSATDSLEIKFNTLITKDAFNKSQDNLNHRLDDFDVRVKTLKDIVSSIIAKLSKGVNLSPEEMKDLRDDLFSDLTSDLDKRIPKDLDQRIESLECLKDLLRTKIDKVNNIQKTPITTADIRQMKKDMMEEIFLEIDKRHPHDLGARMDKLDEKLNKIHYVKGKVHEAPAPVEAKMISDELLAKKMQNISTASSQNVAVAGLAPVHDSAPSSHASSRMDVDIDALDPEKALAKLEGVLEKRKGEILSDKDLIALRQNESALDNAALEISMAKMDILDGNKSGAMARLKRSALSINSVAD